MCIYIYIYIHTHTHTHIYIERYMYIDNVVKSSRKAPPPPGLRPWGAALAFGRRTLSPPRRRERTTAEFYALRCGALRCAALRCAALRCSGYSTLEIHGTHQKCLRPARSYDIIRLNHVSIVLFQFVFIFRISMCYALFEAMLKELCFLL